eukprot:403340520
MNTEQIKNKQVQDTLTRLDKLISQQFPNEKAALLDPFNTYHRVSASRREEMSHRSPGLRGETSHQDLSNHTISQQNTSRLINNSNSRSPEKKIEIYRSGNRINENQIHDRMSESRQKDRESKIIQIKSMRRNSSVGQLPKNKNTPFINMKNKERDNMSSSKNTDRPLSPAEMFPDHYPKKHYDPVTGEELKPKRRLLKSQGGGMIRQPKNAFEEKLSYAHHTSDQKGLNESGESKKHQPILSLNAKYIQQLMQSQQIGNLGSSSSHQDLAKQSFMAVNLRSSQSNHLLKTMPRMKYGSKLAYQQNFALQQKSIYSQHKKQQLNLIDQIQKQQNNQATLLGQKTLIHDFNLLQDQLHSNLNSKRKNKTMGLHEQINLINTNNQSDLLESQIKNGSTIPTKRLTFDDQLIKPDQQSQLLNPQSSQKQRYTLQNNPNRPMSAQISLIKSASQPRLQSAIAQPKITSLITPNQQYTSSPQFQDMKFLSVTRPQTANNNNAKIIRFNRNRTSLSKPNNRTRSINQGLQQTLSGLFHSKDNMSIFDESKFGGQNNLHQLSQQNLDNSFNGNPQSIVVSIQDMTTAERLKLKQYARKSRNLALTGEQTQLINKLRDDGVKILAKYLVSNTSIMHLDLSQNEITHKGATDLFQCLSQNNSIVSLDIGSYDGQSRNRIGPKGLQKLHSILIMPNTMLSFLYLAGNYIGNQGVQILASGLENNERIIALDLSNNEISGTQGADGLCQILQNKNNQIIKLILSKNPLGNNGIERFSWSLKQDHCKVKFLNLSKCEFTQVGARFLYLGVRVCHSIQTLILDKNRLDGASVTVLQQMLWVNSSLQNLSMASCNLKDEGMKSLCDGLERNTSIRSLILQNNQITDKSIINLAKLFGICKLAIKLLDLSYNYITHKSGIQLFENLANNETIQTLIINNNSLGDEAAQELIQTLKKNRFIRKINLQHNGMNLRFVDEIQEFVSKNEMLAIERVLPNFQHEIKSMANDQKDFDMTTKELLNVCINKAATLNRVKGKEQEFEKEKHHLTSKYNQLLHEANSIQQRFKDIEAINDELDRKHREKSRYVDNKERELRAFIINTQRDQKTVESDLDYYNNEIRQKKEQYNQKRAEMVFELQDIQRKVEMERRSYFTLLDVYEQMKSEQNPSHQKSSIVLQQHPDSQDPKQTLLTVGNAQQPKQPLRSKKSANDLKRKRTLSSKQLPTTSNNINTNLDSQHPLVTETNEDLSLIINQPVLTQGSGIKRSSIISSNSKSQKGGGQQQLQKRRAKSTNKPVSNTVKRKVGTKKQ